MRSSPVLAGAGALLALAGCAASSGAPAPATSSAPSAPAAAAAVRLCELAPVGTSPTPPPLTDPTDPAIVIAVHDGSSCADNALSFQVWWSYPGTVAALAQAGLVLTCSTDGVDVYAIPPKGSKISPDHRAARRYCDPNYTGN